MKKLRLEIQEKLAYVDQLLYKIQGYEEKRKIGTTVLSIPDIDKITKRLQQVGLADDDPSLTRLFMRLRELTVQKTVKWEPTMGQAEAALITQLRSYLEEKKAALERALRQAA